ncbi:MAG: hypothetical protein KAJ14_04480 [Candidatus Omnitrophica bacterium]|nr:hypothetical protein [Candidatus Omnitrophota bacterium]
MENKIKHLEIIQGVINRMAQCSFLLKGWTVVLVSALFALAAKDSNILFIYLAYFPAIAFWILDGYYLYQERLYRNLYDKTRNTEESNIDFSMNKKEFEGKNKASWIDSILSKTLLIFHLSIILTIIIVMIISLK